MRRFRLYLIHLSAFRLNRTAPARVLTCFRMDVRRLLPCRYGQILTGWSCPVVYSLTRAVRGQVVEMRLRRYAPTVA